MLSKFRMKRKRARYFGLVPSNWDNNWHDEEHRRWHMGLSRFMDEMRYRIGSMRRHQLEKEVRHAGLMSREEKGSLELGWLRRRLAYHLQEGRRASLGLATPRLVRQRIEELDGSRRLPTWTVDSFMGAGDGSMSKHEKEEKKKAKAEKSGKEQKPEKRTIGKFMRDLLRSKVVPPNERIVEIVKAEFPESAFNNGHVSWYKGAFNAGKLAEQGGKGEAFNQPVVSAKRKAAGEKAAEAAAKKKAGKGKVKAAPAKEEEEDDEEDEEEEDDDEDDEGDD